MLDRFIDPYVVSSGFILIFMLVSFVPFILCVVLFVKLWIMTNDVRKIKDIIEERLNLEHAYTDTVATSEPQTPTDSQT
jgi:nitrate/nitrite transporter NarK